jgi:hypothetical protein
LTAAGQILSCPVRICKVFGKLDRKCWATMEFFGDHGSADKYIWGALVAIGVTKLTANLAASAANALMSVSDIYTTSSIDHLKQNHITTHLNPLLD